MIVRARISARLRLSEPLPRVSRATPHPSQPFPLHAQKTVSFKLAVIKIQFPVRINLRVPLTPRWGGGWFVARRAGRRERRSTCRARKSYSALLRGRSTGKRGLLIILYYSIILGCIAEA